MQISKNEQASQGGPGPAGSWRAHLCGECSFCGRTSFSGNAANSSIRQGAFSGKRRLLYFPGVTRTKELAEVAAPALGDDVPDLLVHHVFVAWHIAPRAENPDGRGEVRPMLHVRELEGVCRTRVVRIVNHQIRLADTVSELDDFDVAVRLSANTFVAVLAENHGLAMFELEDVLAAGVAVGE